LITLSSGSILRKSGQKVGSLSSTRSYGPAPASSIRH